MISCSRRDFFKLPLALGATALFERDGAGAGRRVIDEYDPANIKLAHRVPARIGGDDLLFLKQIGMRWAPAGWSRSLPCWHSNDSRKRQKARRGFLITGAGPYPRWICARWLPASRQVSG